MREDVGDWRDRPALSGTDLADFLALRRVCGQSDSYVHQVGTHFVDNQRPVLPFLADGLTALIEVGHLTLGDPDSGEARPVRVTATGRARYEDLCDAQGASIRDLMAETGRSYGWTHRLLRESGVQLRGRGGAHPRRRTTPAQAGTEPVAVGASDVS